MKILILGAGGMLGHKVVEKLSHWDIITPSRDEFDASAPNLAKFDLKRGDYVVNCIGKIPQRSPNVKDLIYINAAFPHWLAANTEARIIHITTDCVFNGRAGSYTESSPHNALTLYGKSKSLGEVNSSNVMNLRASIVGKSVTGFGLLEWVRSRPENQQIDGYFDHLWNGIPTGTMADMIRAIIQFNLFYPGTQHIVPQAFLTKNRLVRMFAEKLDRPDLEIMTKITGQRSNMTLSTIFAEYNQDLWQYIGYKTIPSVEELIREMDV
jgi:dTDP-4-dehydrorhamnose reductase